MNDAPGPASLVTERCDTLPAPTLDERERIAGMPADRAAHRRAAAGLAALHRVEDGRLADAPRARGPVDVAFWNVERGRHLDGIVRVLDAASPAACLLCELDLGMARSGLRHTTRDLARALGAGYVFGVEFLELGLGDAREQALHAGESNAESLHGAAIVSPLALERPAIVRLSLDGAWFDGANGERRVGGRIAILATLPVDGVPVVLASVHLESHGDPTSRAREMRTLLEAIETYAPGAAVLVGGDLNTQSAARADMADAAKARPLLDADPGRRLDPVPHEPLFAVAGELGYEWTACNVARAPTTRLMPHHPPEKPLAKLDWFLARGLVTREPRVVPARDPLGGADLSDHELLVVTVERAESSGRSI